ncbi:MAG: hypothetical protein JSR59_07735 [Proteobacteria bacterium]|nr:hypothetical protein [Pseudomonadota bacterium]
MIQRLAPIAAALAACALASNAHAQATDWQSVATACQPNSLPALQLVQYIAPGSALRAPLGPNPPLAYTCNTLDSFNGIVPIWNWLRLQYFDPNGGAVTAQLFQKDKVTGAIALIATAVSTASGAINTVQAPLPALNYANNAYYIQITMIPQSTVRVQAHMVTLAQ